MSSATSTVPPAPSSAPRSSLRRSSVDTPIRIDPNSWSPASIGSRTSNVRSE